MKQKIKEKFIAQKLREKEMSDGEIQKYISISRSTLSYWLRNLALSNEAKKILRDKEKSRYFSSKAIREKGVEKTRRILNKSVKEVERLQDNPLFIVGLMLYWAEGDKLNENVKFSNSDPLMIKLMMMWFREICMVPEKKFRIQLHTHTLHITKDVEKYWVGITKIPRSQFNKTCVKPTSLRYRKNKLYYGTCSIRISDKDLFRKIMGWKMGYLKNFGLRFKYHIPGIKLI